MSSIQKWFQYWQIFVLDDILNTEKTKFIRFVLIPSSDIRVLKKKWKYGIIAEHHNIFNTYSMYIWKPIRELYIASESSYHKGVVITFRIGKVISPKKKSTKIKEVELTFDVTNKSLYDNPVHLMLSWLDRNKFYNKYYISKYKTHIIRSAFGGSGSYGSRFQCYPY